MKTFSIILVFFLKLYQIFFLFFKTLIRWINISLGFYLKVICRIWMFRVGGKHLILNGSWWKFYQFIMVLFLEPYQLLFLFFKTFIRWRNIMFEFSLKVFWWEHVLFSFRLSIICFRLSYFLLKSWSAVSRYTFSSLAD